MSTNDPIRLLPRNVAARRRLGAPVMTVDLVAGNPVSTRLESGVGNCYPGLECDLRNLERRFFPFLEVDISDPDVTIASVDDKAVRAARAAGTLDAPTAQAYLKIHRGLRQRQTWTLIALHGEFGALGLHSLDLTAPKTQSFGRDREPIDNWTAVRLLSEDSLVELTVRHGSTHLKLSGRRVRYTGDDGALASFFRPGELTQSLCSPWTHDFRDCGCFYWASNHPDIAQPPAPVPPSDDVAWKSLVIWERKNRDTTLPPDAQTLAQAGDTGNLELRHYEINHRWQELNFVVEGRELLGPYAPLRPTGTPLKDRDTLIAHLGYAAGVELAVMHEYLAAAFSLRRPGSATGILADDIEAAHAEMLRVTIGEMRHLRAVNDVLRSLDPKNYEPALQVATQVPGTLPGSLRPVNIRAAIPAAIDDFIAVEAPSVSVDGYYMRILATLEAMRLSDLAGTIRTVMTEGADHWQTFQFIKHWLGRHQPGEYLAVIEDRPTPQSRPAYATLQKRYFDLLDLLYQGYALGLPEGAGQINEARASMPDTTRGLAAAALAVAHTGRLVRFDAIADPRFAAIQPPP